MKAIAVSKPRTIDGKFEKRTSPSVYNVKARGGNSETYLAAVLKRDHPDIAAAVEQGKYRSIRAAALEAGIVKKTLTVPNDPERAARSIVRNFGKEFAEELVRYLIEEQQGEVAQPIQTNDPIGR